MTPIRAYHFVGETLRDGRPVPADGVWLEHTGPLVLLCQSGLHASLDPWDALQHAPGPFLCLVDVGGEILHGADKLAGRRRRIVARFDASEILRAHARQSALSVIHLWGAPAVVREFLETGDESKRAAALDAAMDAARAASCPDARYAAWAAALDAAWAAVSYDARTRFRESVEAHFRAMGALP